MSLEKMADHGVVPMADEHFPQVVELYGVTFGDSDRWAERFSRLYHQAPARAKSDETNWLLIRRGKVVGHVGFIYVRVRLGASERKAAWGIDLMVHPKHRFGRGFLALLTALDHSADLAMGYGMAEAVFRSYLKRGYDGHRVGSHLIVPKRPWTSYRLFGSQACWGVRHIERSWLASALFARSSCSMLTARSRTQQRSDVTEIDLRQLPAVELDDWWHRLAADYSFAVVRDAAYLTWRYLVLPEARPRCLVRREGSELAGLAILEYFRRHGLRVLQISELLVPKADRQRDIPLFVDAIMRIFRRENADVLWTEGLPSDLRGMLKGIGFVELDSLRREKMAYLDKAGERPQDSAGEWLLSPGDSDRSTSYPRLPWKYLS